MAGAPTGGRSPEFQDGGTALVDVNEEGYTFEKKRPDGRPSGREKVAAGAS